ncbi:hypothetical protein LRC484719_33030 [Mycobacterium riyadhense]
MHVARRGAQFIGKRLTFVMKDVANHHFGTLGDKQPRMRLPHPARSAADQSNLRIDASHDGPGYWRCLALLEPVLIRSNTDSLWRPGGG